jgi:hypothetical protein
MILGHTLLFPDILQHFHNLAVFFPIPALGPLETLLLLFLLDNITSQ